MRMIDADKYKEKLYAMMPEFDEENDKKCIEGQTIFFCIAALNDMPTIAPPPNDPLTLEELREMDGEPVWVELIAIDRPPAWFLLNLRDDEAINKRGGFVSLIDYGKTWIAYRRKPEEGTT